jgi:transcriptional regulator with XRE-family HTH domain
MSKSKEEILKRLQSKVDLKTSNWQEEAEYRLANKDWLRKSQMIAVRILRELRSRQIKQKALAENLGVSPQQVNKWVKGRENFTLETISKIEKALEIELISVNKEKEDFWTAIEKYIAEYTFEPLKPEEIEEIEHEEYVEQTISEGESEAKVIPMYPEKESQWTEMELEEM